MRSGNTANFALVMVSFCLIPPSVVADELLPEQYHSDSTIRLEPFRAKAASHGPFLNSAAAGNGELFTLPLVGKLESVGVRISSARDNFGGLVQQAIFTDFRTPWGWSTPAGTYTSLRLSFEMGRFLRASENRYFVSLGPNVRIVNDRWRVPLFLDLGLTPTIIGGSSYGDQDLGTSLNFTSHIGLGVKYGHMKLQEVRLRFQHISNGGINEVNPGVNMIGLDFVFKGRRN